LPGSLSISGHISPDTATQLGTSGKRSWLVSGRQAIVFSHLAVMRSMQPAALVELFGLPPLPVSLPSQASSHGASDTKIHAPSLESIFTASSAILPPCRPITQVRICFLVEPGEALALVKRQAVARRRW
jgi:hypothetical protein